MKKENDSSVYFIALGPVTGAAFGIIFSLIFLQPAYMTFWISGGTIAGLLGGIILYIIFQDKDNKTK